MPIKGSAEKRQKQSEVRRMRNRMVRSEVRTQEKKFLEAVEAKDKEKAGAEFLAFQKLIDTASKKGVYPKETVSRKKSRLHAKLNKIV